MANLDAEAVTVGRAKIFSSLVMRAGTIKRGLLINRMHISEQTFAREYKTWLEIYPNIEYERDSREFVYKA